LARAVNVLLPENQKYFAATFRALVARYAEKHGLYDGF
jgi:hypothetical protein